jgi:hypothetical protein
MGYVAPLFAVQAALLADLAVRGRVRMAHNRVRRAAGRGLFVAAALAYPALSLVQGRALAGAEVAGIAPDPTAAATLGLALLARDSWRGRAVCAISLAWLGQSALTLYALGGPTAIPPALAMLTALAGVIADRAPPARSR